MSPLFAWTPGWQELLIVAIIGLLLFGRRLPELGRSLGKGIVEFKKGLKGMEDDVDASYNAGTSNADTARPPQRITSAAPKFDEPANPSAPPKI